MAVRIITGFDGRKYITDEPQLHARTYTQAELDVAVSAERQRCAELCLRSRERCRDGADVDFSRGYNAACEEMAYAILAT